MTSISNIKSVLIALTEEGSSELSTALGYAMSLARKAGAHVTVNAASIGVDIPHAHGSSMAAKLVATENRRVHELTERIAEKARGDATMAGVICETETPQLSYADLRDRLLAESRVNDLTVLDADISVLTIDGGLLRTLVFESGRPMIIVPKGADVFECFKIVIAWDGSASASRAVGAAMPFLRAAKTVEIVCYVDDKDLSKSAAGADLGAALTRHGIEVTVNELPSGGDVAERLREHVGYYHADLIVMGAFVHSPLREWLFGGVTQSMLARPPAPLLVTR